MTHLNWFTIATFLGLAGLATITVITGVFAPESFPLVAIIALASATIATAVLSLHDKS
jgi:hypothetical protein